MYLNVCATSTSDIVTYVLHRDIKTAVYIMIQWPIQTSTYQAKRLLTLAL